MTDEESTKIVNRLKSIEGQIRRVTRMVEDEVCCPDIINQIKAIQAALQKVNVLMLDHHLHICVTTALRSDNLAERTQVIGQIMNVFEAKGKFN